MDINMAIMDGYTVTSIIRKYENEGIHSRKNVPIIAMTAHSLEGDREKCLQSGMDDYISKPIDINEFYEKVNTWIFAIKDGKNECI